MIGARGSAQTYSPAKPWRSFPRPRESPTATGLLQQGLFSNFERCLSDDALLVAPHRRRLLPARLDARHIRQFVRDAFVAIDAGPLFRQKISRMDFGGAPRLLGEVHRRGGMAVPAFERIVGLESAPIHAWQVPVAWREISARVEIVPNIFPQTSFDACILRAILSVHSCGTWQSGRSRARPSGWRNARCAAAPGKRCRASRGRRDRTSRCW